jgi:hypothetical protein
MSGAERGVPPADGVGPGAPPHAAEAPAIFARELWDPRVQSKLWLQAMSQAADAWMRSAAFLEFMQHGLEMAIAAKRLQNRGSMNIALDVEPAGAHEGPTSSTSCSIPRGDQVKGKREP